MLKFVSFGLIAATSSFITSVLLGDSLIRALLIAPLAGSGALMLWGVAAFLAYRHHIPYADAAAMNRGVCPSCRAFGGLEEVTSADPNTRCVHCHACDQRFAVSFDGQRLAAERLGKSED